MQIFHNPNYNFIKYRWHALVVSWIVILAGLVAIWHFGMPLGVEFSGGTVVIVQFEKMPSVDQVRRALDRGFPGGGQNVVVVTYGQLSDRRIMIRAPHTGKEQGSDLSRTADEVKSALRADLNEVGPFDEKNISTEIVGPVVGKDLTEKGTWAMILSLAGILIYIWFRFQLSFAVGATVATIHDLLVTAAFLVFFRYDMSLNVIAALLTMTGYSMNDTIVIFDRIRENLRGMRKDNLTELVNVAVNQTLNRTIITGGTALLSVIALYLFGGEVLRAFAFTMIVGIITGTYSSVFIAAAIVTFWRTRQPVRAAAAPASGPQAARPAQTARVRTKPPKKARTS
jgi:preprotein translocase subunit SecF